ncbi:MAG: GNAT family N-acetyltransferase [Methanotrichaceae archaeon]|nr:GNAT family N-acetyltransferase [Methanotrichaceae archaeon]
MAIDEMLVDRDSWEGLVEESPYGMLFHRWDFLKVIEEHTGYGFLPIGVHREGQLIGLLPLFYRRFGALRVLLSPPPRTSVPYLGPVLPTDHDRYSQIKREAHSKALVQRLLDLMRTLSPHHVAITCVPGIGDVRPFIWNGFQAEPQYTYELDLDRSLQEIWDGIQYRTRKYIKRSMGKISLRRARTREDIEAFYRMEAERYGSQGLMPPLVSVDYLDDLADAFPESVRLYLIEGEEDLLGIWGVVVYKDRYLTWVGGVRPGQDISIQHVNECAYWLTIEGAREEGCRVYELSGANTPRLCLFKSKFDPSLSTYFRVHKKTAFGAAGEMLYRSVLKRRFH